MGQRPCGPISFFRRQTVHFAAGEQGATLVEYAVMLAMIGGGLMLAIDLIGSTTSGTFAQVSTDLNSRKGTTTSSRWGDQTAFSRSSSKTDHPNVGRVGDWRQKATSVLTILVLSVAWYSLRRSRQREMQRDKAEDAAEVQRPARFIAKRQQMMRTLSNCLAELMEGRLHVCHLMTKQVATALPTATVTDLSVLMAAQEVRHLLICDHEQHILGVVSDRDLRATLGKTAAQIMTCDPVTVPAATPIISAVSMMLDRHFSSLPVVEGKRLVGIVTTTDLAMALQCAMQLISRVGNAEASLPAGLPPCAPMQTSPGYELAEC